MIVASVEPTDTTHLTPPSRPTRRPAEDPLEDVFPSVETPPELDPLEELLLLAKDVPWRRARPRLDHP